MSASVLALDVLTDPARLAALRATGLLDTPPEEEFDRVVRLARRLLGAPSALVTLVDAERQFFKAQAGRDGPCETDLERSFCQYPVVTGEPLVVDDARAHPLVRDNPATGDVLSYVGVPLRTSHGHALGTLCVYGDQPHRWRSEDVRALLDLGAVVVAEIELRAQAERAEAALVAQQHLTAEVAAAGARARAVADAMRESEERYRSLVELNPDAVLVHQDGVVRYANRAAAALFGAAAPAELLGLPILERIHPDDRAMVRERVRAVLERGEVSPVIEERMLRLDGGVVYTDITGAPVQIDGRPAVQVVVRDVTARHFAEAALRESEAVYRTVVESLREGLVITDLAGRALFVNARMGEITGYAPDELVDQLLDDLLLPPGERARMQRRVADRAVGIAERYEVPHVRKDGSTVWVEISGVPLATANGTVVGTVGTVTDISERQRHEREILEARDAAQAASRAKSEFLARMSHELRTPLNSVIGFANILARPDRALAERDRTYAERIAANGRHLLDLINDVLDLSKVEAGHLRVARERVDVARLVRETLQELEGRALESSARLEAVLPERLEPVHTDPSRLKQVLINLVGNALKFTPSGEVRVTVDADPVTGRARRVAITDTGIGIPADRQARIFEAFEQADAGTARRFGGTGLGLSISRALCDALGFRIEVESVEGVGSTFSVVLGPS